jgi:hypothetical protein
MLLENVSHIHVYQLLRNDTYSILIGGKSLHFLLSYTLLTLYFTLIKLLFPSKKLIFSTS